MNPFTFDCQVCGRWSDDGDPVNKVCMACDDGAFQLCGLCGKNPADGMICAACRESMKEKANKRKQRK